MVKVFKYDFKNRKKDGSCKKIKICEGEFLGFGVYYEELERGVGNYSTAIVEIENGEIIEPELSLIQFIDKI